ncbi:MAG: aminotransferase class III [Bacteroides sp. SM23_62_1]|nr:MAG: aminotransferase class III [Bacteroides sp. SM23_62_1]
MDILFNILKNRFRIDAESCEMLYGYANQNWLVTEKNSGNKFVLKTYQEQEIIPIIEAETRVLVKLTEWNPEAIPRPIPAADGKFLITFQSENNEILYARVLRYVEGNFFAEVNKTPGLLASLGTFLAELDLHLLDYRDPILEARQYRWDPQHLLLNQKLVEFIPDLSRRKFVTYFFLQFKDLVLPVLPELRKSVIHNDANDWNILVKNNRITGIIDFGDTAYTPLINELAIGITYAVMDMEDTVKSACSIISAYHQVLPLKETELEILYYLIAARLCISVCNSAYSKNQDPENQYLTISEKSAWALLEKWFTINPLHAADQFVQAAGYQSGLNTDVDRDLQNRLKYFSKALSVSYVRPIKMVGAAFQYMYDAAGKTYLDAYNNIPHVGHSHPRVVESGRRQMALLNTNTRYLYDQFYIYAERLLSYFPPSLNKVFLVNSGSEASDLAIRLARTYTGYQNIMVMEYGYHGHTQTGIEISSHKFNSKGGPGQAGYILKAPIPDTFRGKYRHDNPESSRLYAREALSIMKEVDRPLAAFISEPIVGSAGQIPLPLGYLKELYNGTREKGGVCISDEVQTGFGRTGDHFWGFQRYDVIPDIVILGKPMGNGHPIGAVITTDEITKSFETGMEFFSSFGGNPVSCAIGLAVLDVLEQESLQNHVQKTGEYWKEQLMQLKHRYHVIGDIRGSGFFLGIEFVNDPDTLAPATEFAGFAKNELRNMGILVNTDGPFDNVFKIKPPMCFDRKDVDLFMNKLEEIINKKYKIRNPKF